MKEKELEKTELKKVFNMEKEGISELFGNYWVGDSKVDFYHNKEVNEAFKKGRKIERDEIIKVIDKYLLTDLQGKALPQCKILFRIKQELLNSLGEK